MNVYCTCLVQVDTIYSIDLSRFFSHNQHKPQRFIGKSIRNLDDFITFDTVVYGQLNFLATGASFSGIIRCSKRSDFLTHVR